MTCRSCMLGTALAALLVSTAPADVAQFADVNLEAAVREALGVPDELLESSRLAQLRELAATDRGIRMLGGIQQLTAVEVLDLAGNRIADLAPLTALTRLRMLNLEQNDVVDVSPLSGLTRLEYLVLSRNQVSDIGPLTSLPRLVSVELLGNPLNQRSRADLVPSLQARGVLVLSDPSPGNGTGGPREWDFLGPQGVAANARPSCRGFVGSVRQVVYAYMAQALWRSRDSARTWERRGPKRGPYTLWVAADAQDADVVYTWDPPARSRDGGVTWEDMAVAGRLVAADPLVSGRIYAYEYLGQSLGVLRSDDQGTTWRRAEVTTMHHALDVRGVQLQIHPRDSRRLYVWTYGAGGMPLIVVYDLFTSGDSGLTWERAATSDSLTGIAADPAAPGGLYGVVWDELRYSTDAGQTWAVRGRLPSVNLRSLVVHPANPEWLFAGTQSTYHSVDRGQTWSLVYRGYSTVCPIIGDRERAWVVGDANQALLETRDGGGTWHELSLLLEEIPPTLSVTTAGDGSWLVGSWDQGERLSVPALLRSVDQGRTWTVQRPQLPARVQGAFWRIFVHPLDPQLLLGFGDTDAVPLLRSIDGGEGWSEVRLAASGDPQAVEGPLVLAAGGARGEILYATTPLTAQLHRSRDLGLSWEPVRSGVSSLAVAPQATHAISAAHCETPEVWLSPDAGDTWNSVERVASDLHVYGLALHPLVPRCLFAATEKGLYVSKDGGAWSHLLALPEAPDPAQAFAEMRFSAQDPSVLCLFRASALWRSADEGRSWREIGQDLTDRPWFYDVAVDPRDSGAIIAATPWGVHRWRGQGEPSVVAGAVGPPVARARLLDGRPIPFNVVSTIPYILPQPAGVRLVLYDLLGQVVTVLAEGRRDAGTHTARWEGQNSRGRPVASGIYVCRLWVEGVLAGSARLALVR
ncbi:MAG: leucine-rich repeat domain-containing protein [Candidatus Latescibacterota bacterium]